MPYWSTERPNRRSGTPAPEADRPLVLWETDRGTERVARVNPAAGALGLVPGMRLADARAREPDLEARPLAASADQAALERLAAWCERYSPWVARDGEDGIRLDVTGVAHLFGGEAALLAGLEARLGDFGLTARAAIADTPGAAWALARHGDPLARLAGEGGTRAAIAALPVAALRLPAETVEDLLQLGLARVEPLTQMPSAALAARFGPALAARLDQVLGRVAEPISPARPPPELLCRLVFAEPIGTPADISRAAGHLARDLARELARAGLGARRLEFALYLASGGVERITVGCARPSRDPAHLRRLLEERSGGLAAGFGADVITLAATAVATLDPHQLGFHRLAAADGAAPLDRDPELGLLIDRLGNRLGLRNILRAAPRESHLPERAVRVVAPLSPPQGGGWDEGLARPVRLLPAPEPVEVVAEVPDGPPARFRWRGHDHRIARADGPERLAPEWWRAGGERGAGGRTRDYYRLEDETGARFWLYRDGLYEPAAGEPDEAPRWYLHGVFA